MHTNQKLQLELEQRYAKQNTIHTLKKALGDQAIINGLGTMLDEYVNQEHDYEYEVNGVTKYRLDLVEAHSKLKEIDSTELMYTLFCHVWSKNQGIATVQELVGMCVSKLNMTSTFRKLAAVEIILSVFSTCNLIETNTTKGETIFFKCKIPMTIDLANGISKQGYVLPSITVPKEVTHNKEIGYHTFGSSLILGGKYHTKHQNYSHINRINSVPFEYESRIEELTEPVFNLKPKVKKDGAWETDEDIVKRYKSFKQLHDSLPEKVAVMRMYSNLFYLSHAYCSRGRTHVKAYEYNYQGSGYLKAMVNLNNKSIIKEEF